jgi:hypothetical protein
MSALKGASPREHVITAVELSCTTWGSALGHGCSSSVHYELLFICCGFASFMLLLTVWLVVGGWWQVADPKRLSSMKQQGPGIFNDPQTGQSNCIS